MALATETPIQSTERKPKYPVSNHAAELARLKTQPIDTLRRYALSVGIWERHNKPVLCALLAHERIVWARTGRIDWESKDAETAGIQYLLDMAERFMSHATARAWEKKAHLAAGMDHYGPESPEWSDMPRELIVINSFTGREILESQMHGMIEHDAFTVTEKGREYFLAHNVGGESYRYQRSQQSCA